MPPIINAQSLSKRFGVSPLFENLSFTVNDGDRIGVIGPNGSGKSTVLRILAGILNADAGETSIRKRARVGIVEQNSDFPPGATVNSVALAALDRGLVPENEHAARLAETLGRAGFADFDAAAAALSGGWRKRLAIVEGLIQNPDLLLLDEPTNHLDLAGIQWLEAVLQTAPFACLVVSHDRYLLENFATDIIEINRLFPDGLLRVKGNYGRFLEVKEEFLYAQGQRQEALANRVRGEVEWLRRGAKARTSKSKARIGKANEMIGELAELSARTRVHAAQIDFTASGRKTKKLIDLEDIRYSIGGRVLFERLDFTLKAGMRVGLVGPNGSGKTTLLRLLKGELQPESGTIQTAEHLRIVYFDQNRRLDPGLTLRRTLAPDSDAVVYQERVIHVASWASRFMFSSEDLNQPVGRLSGGERARVLIAQLMLQPADVLLLDEPTNDLDIPTLEILEESLLEYSGALVLVTHDRFMLDRLSTQLLGLDGLGATGPFADSAQWEEWLRTRTRAAPRTPSTDSRPAPAKKKLSYLEAREYATLEDRIAQAEDDLRVKRLALEDSAIASDAARLLELSAQINEAEHAVDALFARWSELESK